MYLVMYVVIRDFRLSKSSCVRFYSLCFLKESMQFIKVYKIASIKLLRYKWEGHLRGALKV